MMENIEKLEKRLWEAADQLRANSKLTSTEYCMPLLGMIFLRQAYNRFSVVKEEIEKNLPKRGGVARAITKDDFARKSALYLAEKSQFDYLLNLPEDQDKGAALIRAMKAIEDDYEDLKDILPKDYHIFDNDLLTRLLKTFNDEALQRAGGDVFGRIYEYFLMKFSMQKAADDGEFFTPVSLVQTIVNVIEPDHGTVFDPACGSGGMFVQTSHFLEKVGMETSRAVTFFGQEKTSFNLRLAKMNLAVHGLEGRIVEANTYYQDEHELLEKCNYVMANPPFNVDSVDSEKVKGDPRLPFGLPGVNKKNEVSNGNYLWISYFYSYLNEKGRAGFVMSSQASSAGGKEAEVRRKIVESGHVDVMISIRSNFFYTRTVPCELWFFDRAKPSHLADKVLMIDARNIFRKVTRKIYDFSPEQLKNISAIVWLYRGQKDKFFGLVKSYLGQMCEHCEGVSVKLDAYGQLLTDLASHLEKFLDGGNGKEIDQALQARYEEAFAEFKDALAVFPEDKSILTEQIKDYKDKYCADLPATNEVQHKGQEAFRPIVEKLRSVAKQIDALQKLGLRALDIATKDLAAKDFDKWDGRAINKLKKDLDPLRTEIVELLRKPRYFHKQIEWLQSRFSTAEFVDAPGLVKLVDREEIQANDWSLTPGRYVGVAPPEVDEEFDFEEALSEVHSELASLNEEAEELSKVIAENFQGLLP